MINNMFYTNIDQSRKLLELGLKLETYDVLLCKNVDDNYEVRSREQTLNTDSFSYRNGYVVPAWSTEALINELPKKIRVNDVEFEFYLSFKEGRWFCAYLNDTFRQQAYYGYWSSLVDMLTEVMSWVLKNKYKEV